MKGSTYSKFTEPHGHHPCCDAAVIFSLLRSEEHYTYEYFFVNSRHERVEGRFFFPFLFPQNETITES